MSVEAYLGVDPGERWIGLAVLQKQRGGSWYGKSVIIDRGDKSILQTIRLLQPYIDPAEVVVAEDYDQRPVGFNAFSDGKTLRLLGALEVAVKMEHKRFKLIAPGSGKDAAKIWRGAVALNDLFLVKGQARHAASAWRALGKYLMKHRPKLVESFKGELL